MSNLANLKKRAKLYVRWHREGYYPVAACLRTHLPRYRGMSDRAILTDRFQLSDAQELVARIEGFANWQALREGLATMSDRDDLPAGQTTLLAAEPQLFVADIDAACAFYTDLLGFSVVFRYGAPPFYAQVAREGARLNLRCVDRPVLDPARCEREQLLAASLTCDDAKPLFLAYQAAGVPMVQTLRDEPWGARTFIVRDPDGNLLLFAGRGR